MSSNTEIVGKKTSKIEVRGEPEWVAWVHVAAERIGLSASSYIRQATIERMLREGVPKPSKVTKRKRDS